MLRIYQGLTANVAQRDIFDITATDSHIGFIGNFNSVPADVDRCAVCIDVVILRYLETPQISIFDPSSTTALLGRFRKSATPLALWCICANSFSRHGAMPLPTLGVTTSRERK